MKKIIGFLVFLYITNSCYSQMDTAKWTFIGIQNGDTIWIQKPNMADKLRDEGDYDKAIIEYKKILKEEPNDRNNLYNLACIYSITGKKDSAFAYLAIATKNDSSEYVLTDPDYYNLTDDTRWRLLENEQIKKIENQAGHKFENVEVTKELWRIGIADQAYYSQIEIAEKKYGHKSTITDSLWKIKNKLNARNLDKVKQLIDKYGWPKNSVFGQRAVQMAFLVIQHSDLKDQKKYLPLLNEACKKNEADWQDYALMKDRILTDEGKLQIYGSQIIYNEKLKVYELLPLEDPANVDKRRACVGLGPLKDYVKQWQLEFNVPQNN